MYLAKPSLYLVASMKYTVILNFKRFFIKIVVHLHAEVNISCYDSVSHRYRENRLQFKLLFRYIIIICIYQPIRIMGTVRC